MKLLPKPADWTGAKCLHASPKDWDIERLKRFKRTPDRLNYAAAQCAGCPLVERCAADALATDRAGTIRAGIPLRPIRPGTYGRICPRTRAALRMVIAGEQPLRAAQQAGIKVML